MTDRPTAASTPNPVKFGRLAVLFAVCCVAIATPFAFTGIAVGLPAISRSIGGSPVALNWAINAFLLTFGSTLMAAGTLADTFGRRRVFLSGLAIFSALSAGLVFADDIFWFDTLRALQGLGAAAAFAAGFASLAQEYEGADRLRAFSVVGASFGIGLAFGPVASGWLISAFGWPAIFVLVSTLSMAALLLGTFFMRESHDPAAAGLDWIGAVTFTLALTALTFGVIQAPESGWSDPVVIAAIAGSGLLFIAFWQIERLAVRPMLDLSLFRFPRFLGAQSLAVAPSYAFVVLLVLLPARFIGIEGMQEYQAGRMMLALSAPFLVLPVAAGLLTRWLAPATLCGMGLAISAIGLYWLSLCPLGSAPRVLVLPLLMIGVGISLPWGLMDGLAVSVVPKERAGMATGIFSTSRVASEGLVLALMTAALSALIANYLRVDTGNWAGALAQRLVTGDLQGASLIAPTLDGDALLAGYDHAFSALLWILSGATMITAVIVFLFLGGGHEAVEDIEDEAGLIASTSSSDDMR